MGGTGEVFDFIMDYEEARKYVNDSSKYGIVPGLSNIKRLCTALGNPQEGLSVIHIAGTNGKGSTGAFVEAVLRDAGIKTGRFVSPAVFEYTEQFTVNGENIPKERYAWYINKIRTAVIGITGNGYPHPTPFEIETAAAFMYFNDEKCDAVLIEAGMGGGLDATNVISRSLVSVITPIGIDHANFLGDTEEKIAEEKAGIIKENGIVVTAPQSETVMNVIKNTANMKNADLFVSAAECNYKISLPGEYQRRNAALASEVCRHTGFDITETNIENGLKHAVWHGRFEKICDSPEFIIDGAHNIHGAQALMESIDLFYKNRRIIYITGIFRDKEYEKIAEITADRAEKIYTVTPDNPRGLDNKILAKTIRKYNKNTEAVTLDAALRMCLNERDAVIVAFGTLSFLGTIKKKADDMLKMKKVNNILSNEKFRSLLMQIEEMEKDRIYCRHGISHLMEVARAGYILNLENKLEIPKEIIYGAALLHDVGRLEQYNKGIHHHEAGAAIAAEILPQCGYTHEETELIVGAIKEHRNLPKKIETLGDVIASADKATRMCMLCGAFDTCKWKEEERNLGLTI